MIKYDREVLVNVLVYHYRNENASCGCGWAELGCSHPKHVADVYEQSMTAREEPADVDEHLIIGWCALCGRFCTKTRQVYSLHEGIGLLEVAQEVNHFVNEPCGCDSIRQRQIQSLVSTYMPAGAYLRAFERMKLW